MSSGPRLLVALLAAGLVSVPAAQTAISQSRPSERHPDFDIRDSREPAPPRADVDLAGSANGRSRRGPRVNRESGSVRLLTDSRLSVSPGSGSASVRALLASNAPLLGLDRQDLATLTLVRDYVSPSNGVRHFLFRQVVDGMAVFDSSVGIHVRPDGTVVRVTSNAAPVSRRDATTSVSGAEARTAALTHAGDGQASAADMTWLAMDGTLRPAWHVIVTSTDGANVYDVVIDARSAELLVRRNRARQTEGTGRILQSATPVDPRRPDPMPLGGGGTACPPASNHVLRSLNSPFRDASTVLGNTGRLDGNNARIFRGNVSVPATPGTADGNGWAFDFPFNSAASAETFLFFAMNYAHDVFYDLGFTEAAGNFQADNFGRGGVAGDPVKANARAAGRNNANYVHAPEGSSPTINMFLWDGSGCWAEDVDADGVSDLDGDYDLDIVIHEYHHGVSLRLNTAFTGNEAGAMGEGGGDFFAYSVNGDTVLAEYSRPGGLRQVNGKHYGDWTCLLGLICEVHDNGEIWVNALWDVRERFRTDLVRGSEPAAINESHQLYVDGLALSPPAPTMLDMRDAMLEADELRNPGSPASQNFCRLWESFAGRGMGVSATDTSDNGLNRVGPAYDVPAGCDAPPAPPTITVSTSAPTASEASLVPGAITFSRGAASESAVTVRYLIGGTATQGADYTPLQTSVTIPQGAASAVVAIAPLDDAVVENNETVILTITQGSGYVIGTPTSATLTIVSDDVAPDMMVAALTVPRSGAEGGSLDLIDTTRNQGLGGAPASQTSFFLSRNAILDAADPVLGVHAVEPLSPGAAATATTPVVLPVPLEPGTYYLFAKADAPGAIFETNEYNNTKITTIAIGPDLVVTSVTAPSSAGPGSTILVNDTTSNQGAGAAAATTTRFFLSSDVFLDAGDPALQTRPVPALAAATTSTAATMVTIPTTTASGTYYLFAQADASAAVVEANDTNNARSVLIKIGADLAVSAMIGPTRAASGGTIVVTDTTRNIGSGPAGPSTTAFFLSSNYALDAGDMRLNAARVIPALAPNESSTGTTTLTLPAVAPGSWILIGAADDGNTVVETQETNNARFAIIQVGPDLNFLTVTAPSSGLAGGNITVTTNVRNNGGGAAGASVVRFYLSTDAVFDAQDQQLAAVRDVPALATDASHSATTTVALPTNRTGGMYLLFVADGAQAVAEANETNNVAARFIQVNQP